MAWSGSNENLTALTKGIQSFLRSVGMDQYYERFLAKGFDLETDLHFLTTTDLDELNITVPEHRCVLLAAAPLHRVSEDFRVYQWLRDSGLDYYFVSFVRSELVEFDEIKNLDLPDEDLYDELEITLTGHKKRLERAVQKLRKRQRTSEDAEPAIMEGWWGKPVNLTEAKYDFLCVSATIGSTLCPSQCQTVDFMVDSGSDVTTLRQEVLETLDLELLGSIQSRGVHASRTKNLYKARLQIGTEVLEIEVMGESYDSLGSRVFRHFRHYITGSKHVWLKGDYYDPTMIARPIPRPATTELLSDSDDTEGVEVEAMSQEMSDDCSPTVQTNTPDPQSVDVFSDSFNTETGGICTQSQEHQHNPLQTSNSGLEHLATGGDANGESQNATLYSENDVTPCSVNDESPSSVSDEKSGSVNDAVPCSVSDDTPCLENDVAPCSVNDAVSFSVNNVKPCSVNDVTPCSVNEMTSRSENEVTSRAMNDATSCLPNNVTSCSGIGVTSCLVLDKTATGITEISSNIIKIRPGKANLTLQKTNSEYKKRLSPSVPTNCGTGPFSKSQNENAKNSSPCHHEHSDGVGNFTVSPRTKSETRQSSLLLHEQNIESETKQSSLLLHGEKNESESKLNLSLSVARDGELTHRLGLETEYCEILDESEAPLVSQPCDSDSDTSDIS